MKCRGQWEHSDSALLCLSVLQKAWDAQLSSRLLTFSGQLFTYYYRYFLAILLFLYRKTQPFCHTLITDCTTSSVSATSSVSSSNAKVDKKWELNFFFKKWIKKRHILTMTVLQDADYFFLKVLFHSHSMQERDLQFWWFCDTTDLDWFAIGRAVCCWQKAFGPYINLSSLTHRVNRPAAVALAPDSAQVSKPCKLWPCSCFKCLQHTHRAHSVW